MFDYMIDHIVKVTRAIQQPYSNVILVAVPGLGKMAISRMSIFISKFLRTELSMSEEFHEDNWRQSLTQMINSVC